MPVAQPSLTSLLVDGSILLVFQTLPLAGALVIERRHDRYAEREPSGLVDPQSLPEGSPTRENEPLAG